MKPGVKTSELWLNVAAVLLPAINAQFHWHIPANEVLAVIGAAVAYTAARSAVKRGSANAMTALGTTAG